MPKSKKEEVERRGDKHINTVMKYLRSPDPPQFKMRQYEKMLNGYENMVITHGRSGIVRYNDEFLRFCGLVGDRSQSLPELEGKDKA